MTVLEREEFMAAAKRAAEQGNGTKTGTEARDWLVAQAARGS